MRSELALPKFCVFSLIVVLFEFVDTKIYYNTLPPAIVKNVSHNSTAAGLTCRLKPDTGPCRANIPMYYFDPRDGTCYQFPWGGCQGNGNRFDTEKECLNTCRRNITDKYHPRWCTLTFDYGYCFGAVTRYYYDRLWKVCKERIYSGCGGNRNNFYSFEQCEAICRFGNKPLVKSKKSGKGLKKVLIINPKGATTRGRSDQATTVSTTVLFVSTTTMPPMNL